MDQSEVSIEDMWTNHRSVLRLCGPIRSQYYLPPRPFVDRTPAPDLVVLLDDARGAPPRYPRTQFVLKYFSDGIKYFLMNDVMYLDRQSDDVSVSKQILQELFHLAAVPVHRD